MNFLNGMKNGKEIEYYENGNKKLESEFKIIKKQVYGQFTLKMERYQQHSHI